MAKKKKTALDLNLSTKKKFSTIVKECALVIVFRPCLCKSVHFYSFPSHHTFQFSCGFLSYFFIQAFLLAAEQHRKKLNQIKHSSFMKSFPGFFFHSVQVFHRFSELQFFIRIHLAMVNRRREKPSAMPW